MKVRLQQGSPNFTFYLYDEEGQEVQFVQNDWDWGYLAESLGAELPDPDEVGRSAYLSAAFDWLNDHDGQEFDIDE